MATGPRAEEPGGLQYMGLQRAGHDWATDHTKLWHGYRRIGIFI